MTRFYAANQYRGLEEAVNAIAGDESDNEYDLIILPPEPDVLTDVEEGEDDLQTSELPRDIPGTIEVIRQRRHSSEMSEWEDSDDEPLSNKRMRPNQGDIIPPTWRKCSPSYSSSSQPTESNTRSSQKTQLIEHLKNLSPVEVFDKIFDTEIYDLILSNTLLYAGQNNRHGFMLDRDDLCRFLGILILSGYHRLPRERQYWSYDEDLGVPLVARSMSRNRFLDIKRNLHLVDNSLASTSNDKMFKIRPLVESLNQKIIKMEFFMKTYR
ncbi:PiggyBac transposable element-derived protein 3 [Eumeta japonica]|uniref:PiggyBac transposable element-derived protein 3 n=1 Tax=Eumeta variegata TaxID=151549 RepID=A0A4C1ZQ41_EUMVA|nr:PiggyBac transposable element-derived protein 3 [Eumeta japonica]